MLEFFKKIFESDFLPRGACYRWNPTVLWLTVISDLIISAAYYAIPILLFVFVRRRKDFAFNWILLAFAVFILACGATHLLGVWTVWHATYRLDAVVKAITAAASITTALLLLPLLPTLVQMPNPTQLADMNQKLAQEAEELERAAEGLRRHTGLLDLARDAIMVRDWDGAICFWNRGAERLYGWRREEALGRVKHELLKTQFPIPHASIQEEVLRSGFWEGELLHTRRDGTKVTVLSRWASRRTNEGGSEILEINTDISERKRIEGALQEKNAGLERANGRFRQLLESAPDGIVIVNRDGVIVLVNSQAERLFGYSREELLDQPIEMLLPERFRGGHTQNRTGYFGEPKIRPMDAGLDLKGRRKDASEFPIEISLSPMETEEGVLAVSSIRDATERKEFERVLRDKNVELEKASAAKDLFLSSMSHELRTPLNSILGFTGTLLMKLPGPLTTDQEKQLKTIQASGRHLLSIVNDLLDLAKIESGKVEVQLQRASCQEVLAEVVSALRPLAEAKSIALDVRFRDRPLMVSTDRRALSQIVFNLGNNAIKFTPEGSVRLELADAPGNDTSNATNNDTPGNGAPMAAIHVVDTGIGIKPEDQEKLFRAFERIDGGSRVEGAGLGLYLCRKLAELIGGRIEFQSEYGHGSRFTLLIPKG
jgi:PAS domain S-box-containing protein